ncbi:MAG: peptidoglycan bridge formation glycyltransferase FemA/FemB family protein [Microgenomates group bacterium]
MITRILYDEEKLAYNKLVKHPIQTWEWGDFQKKEGHRVYRLGVFENDKLISAYSVSFHGIPHTKYSIGTILRGPAIDIEMINNIRKIALDENAIFVKFEPDVYQKTFDLNNQPTTVNELPHFNDLHVSPKVAFYPYSYVIDLSQTEDELLAAMHSKTRYNIKIANRHGVKVEEVNTAAGFAKYLELLFDTTKRQGFYLHSHNYHRTQWEILQKTKIPHIMLASYQGKVLSAFMLFTLGKKLFYPYGASLDIHREVMAPTLLMWECIKFGKQMGLKTFDMWGSLGPDARESDQGYGFHRFKQSYGGQLVQFIGTYDLVISPKLYQLYNLVDKYRWKLLRLRADIIGRFKS